MIMAVTALQTNIVPQGKADIVITSAAGKMIMAVRALQSNTNHALVWFILQGQQRHFML